MYVFLLSHVGYLGIIIEIIWNYMPLFFVILRVYTLYSNFVCISSILNTRLEKVVAIGIIALGCLASTLAVQYFVPMESISNQSTSNVLTFLSRSLHDIRYKAFN
jgi:ABC-type Mn2+/Zn2+ transport system permease subunit